MFAFRLTETPRFYSSQASTAKRPERRRRSASSLFNRASLWREHYAPDSNTPFGIIPKTLNLKDSSADLLRLIEWLQIITVEHGPIAAIFVDTLARSMGNGDENLARDMGWLISSCDRLREEFATPFGLNAEFSLQSPPRRDKRNYSK